MASRVPKRPKLVPANPQLWDNIKQQARSKFVWPSVWGSAWLVNQYKRSGGGFLNERPKVSRLRQHIASMQHHDDGVATSYWPSRSAVHTQETFRASKTYPVQTLNAVRTGRHSMSNPM